MKILLAGGGSGGSVSPVLAVAQEIRKAKPKTEFLFVGTRRGPERAMVTAAGIKFVTIPAARWRRFISLKNIAAPFVLIAGLVASWQVVAKFKPDVMFAAGAFVAVPTAWVAWLLGAKIITHQQDAKPGLANKLIAPIAAQITTAFEATSKQFYSGSGLVGKLKPAMWVGNPVREELFQNQAVKLPFELHQNLPVLLVVGGATGAQQINFLIGEILSQLVKSFQVIHQTGSGKSASMFSHPNYHPLALLPFDQYAYLLRKCELVVCRAGLSTIAELSALAKPAIVIPMPFTHQEYNALILKLSGAAIILTHNQAHPAVLLKIITALNFDPAAMKELSQNMLKLMPKDAAKKIADLIIAS